MKQTLKYALAAALGTALFVPAFAQGNFPDVPRTHWAYDALLEMKREGILVGYPDGLFRGPRTATRYELAIAINAVYQRLTSLVGGLEGQIEELKDMIDNIEPGTDTSSLKTQLDALQRDVNGMKAWGDDIQNLKRLSEEFRAELETLGVNMAELESDLADLESRVSKLEEYKPAVNISGDLNLLILAGNSRDGRLGMDKTGKFVGAQEENNAPVGLVDDLNVYHELAFNFEGTNEEGPTWVATLVYSNLLGFAANGNPLGFGDVNNLYPGTPYTAGNGSVSIQQLAVNFDTSLVGLPFSATVGRIGWRNTNKLVAYSQDVTPYFKNDRWDGGTYLVDGALLGFDFGGVELDVYAGANSKIAGTQGLITSIVPPGANLVVDTTLGAEVRVPLGGKGHVSAVYNFHDIDDNVTGIIPNNSPDRLNVFGLEGAYSFGDIKLGASYAQSLMTNNTDEIAGLNDSNQAATGYVKYDQDNWGVGVEYRRIQRNFFSPGGWRRIGTNWNPTNIETFTPMAWISLGDSLKLSASGEFGNPLATANGQNEDDDILNIMGKLEYQLNDAWKAMLMYEEVKIESAVNAPDLRQRWATLGLSYALGGNADLSLFYEYGAVSNPYAWGAGATGDYSGGLLGTQISLRF